MNRIYMKVIVLITIICILLSNSNIVLAVTQSEINSQKNEQGKVSDKIDEVQEQQEEISNKKTEAQKQVENLNSQIDSYESEIDELDTQISSTSNKISQAEKKIKEDEEEYKIKQAALADRIVTMYENGDISYLDVLLSASSLTDFISSYYILSELTTYDQEMLKSIEDEKTKIENEKKELEENKKTLDTAKKSKEAKANQLTVVKKEKTTYVAELSEEEAVLEKQLAELKSYESSISSKIKQMQAAYDKELEEARKKAAAAAAAGAKKNKSSSSSSKASSSGTTTNANSSTGSYGFGWPVANPVIGTGYGVSGRYWSSGHHTGVDFRASDGTAIFSIGDGQVFDTGYSSAYGNYVEIYHGNNIYSFYAHASRVQVSVGQRVTKGQQIMLSGHSGKVTGPHLHFEIRTPGYKYANCVNPIKYLP